MKYVIKWVHGHYNVYSAAGTFLFSADSEKEAWDEISTLDSAV